MTSEQPKPILDSDMIGTAKVTIGVTKWEWDGIQDGDEETHDPTSQETVTIWVDADGNQIHDPDLIDRLEKHHARGEEHESTDHRTA